MPFKSYEEIYATIQYDSRLKALFYEKMMFIETAVKNIALESILSKANSENIQDMFDRVVSSYKNAPTGFNADQKKVLQQNKLNLQNSIQGSLARAYKADNTKITYFEKLYIKLALSLIFLYTIVSNWGICLRTYT